MKQDIIRRTLTILGSSIEQLQGDAKSTKAVTLCEAFITNAVEEAFIAVKWPFALRKISNLEGSIQNFTQVEEVEDCLKVAVIAPSNLQWYVEENRIFFKGKKMDSLFYHSNNILRRILNNEPEIVQNVPESFKTLAAFSLVSLISFAMYSDSLFADGLRKQHLLKLEETRRLYSVDYNIDNSGAI